jgi:hypothetical protein
MASGGGGVEPSDADRMRRRELYEDAGANIAQATRSGTHGSETARWLERAGLAEVP